MDFILLKRLICVSVVLGLISCSPDGLFTREDTQKVADEVRQMLNDYYSDINREGLMAEFKYLDDSPDFFWNPPSYNATLTYDSVKAEVERNARRYRSVRFSWDTLRVVPLSHNIASYTGIVKGTMTDTSGVQTDVSLLESGTAVQRLSGWKILNGHTSILNTPSVNVSTITNNGHTMKRVTGVGGIFFKSKDPQKLKEWYNEHLGFEIDQWGTNFEWRQGDDPSKYGFTQWSPFKESTSYFKPSEKEFMINYRVENLEWLVEQLKKEGVTILDEIETYDYGKFVHILDNEGNKVELWEPVDAEYDKIVDGRTK